MLKIKNYFCNMSPIIDYNYMISTDIFTLNVCRTQKKRISLLRQHGHASVLCPVMTNFYDDYMQYVIAQLVIRAMREEMRRTVVPRLRYLSEQTGITYARSFIRQSHTRWGSCSSAGNINLSLFLMALPKRYIDYVLLHELCHRCEMNHSPKFWALLDTLTGCDSKRLSKEMNKYSVKVIPLLRPIIAVTRRYNR